MRKGQKCARRADGIYLYGCGVQKLYVVRFLQKHGIKIKAILDTFRQGSYEGIPVILFDDFPRSGPNPESWFVISAPEAEKEIRETLERHFPKGQIFSLEMSPYVEWIPDVEWYRAYLLEHWDRLSSFYDALADECSKETLVNIIKGRISGRTGYFRAVYEPKKYYPAGIIDLSSNEILAEAGSYNGATLLRFLKHCPEYKATYCFEPDKDNLRTLREVVERTYQGEKTKVIPRGVWDRRTVLHFSRDDKMNLSHVEESGEASDRIEVVTIDEAVSEPVTYLTMSINGSELSALHGAKAQIMKNRPKIAVCVSCSGECLLEIWDYLRELVPEYRFYLRHHLENAGVESFLYAV